MLEGSGQTFTSSVPNKERSEQRETKKGDPDSNPEKMKQKEPKFPEEGISPQNPDSPGKLCCLALHKRHPEISKIVGCITAVLNLSW